MAAKSPKTDPIEMDRRVGEVVDLILAGLSMRELHRYIREKHPDWDLGDRQRRRLIERAREEIARAAKPLRELEIGKALMRYDVLYRRSFAINDYKTCAQIVNKVTDLLGLAAPTRVEHSGPDGGPIQHEDETPLPTLRAEIERLGIDLFAGGLQATLQPADRLPEGFAEPA
ncbi:MAG: hypothetical protein JW990_21330 [Thermoleophilia bacterium]|nr:hypothetical protein [Thermoleophilia bacterium]